MPDLASLGLPPRLHLGVEQRYGEAAGALLGDDPWALLAVPGASPGQADGLARTLGVAGGAARERALLGWLLARAARAGHTASPAGVLRRALSALDVADPARVLATAAEAGDVVEAAGVGPGEAPVSLVVPAELAELEDTLAEGLERLLVTAEVRGGPEGNDRPSPGSDGGLSVVLGCCAAARLPLLTAAAQAARDNGREPVVADVPAQPAGRLAAALGLPLADAGQLGSAGTVFVEEAQLLDLARCAALVEAMADGSQLVLAGDVESLPGAGNGDVLADVVASRVVPVHRAGCPGDAEVAAPGAAPDGDPDVASACATASDLAHAVRAGRLPPIRSADHALVAVAADGDEECLRRVIQLVTVSVPRAFGVEAAEVAVLSPLRRGPAGTEALDAALGGRGQVRTVHDAAGSSYDTVVLVLPAQSAGVLSRPLVHAGITTARRHLSVVNAVGAALPQVVETVVRRRRTTRLEALLRAANAS